MGRFLAPLTVLTAFATLAKAGIHFTSPKGGDKLTAGDAIKVEWEEKGSGPGPDDLTTYQLFLCAGPNDASDANTIVGYTLLLPGANTLMTRYRISIYRFLAILQREEVQHKVRRLRQ